MANYQEYATYSETGETFKDKDCHVLSLSFENGGVGVGKKGCVWRGGEGTEGSNKLTAPLQQGAGFVAGVWNSEHQMFLQLC